MARSANSSLSNSVRSAHPASTPTRAASPASTTSRLAVDAPPAGLIRHGQASVVGVRPAGGEEREELQPVAPLVEVEVGHQHRRLVAWRLHEDATVRVGDERRAVEGERRLVADAVDGDHERGVGDPVGHDDLLPQRLRCRTAGSSGSEPMAVGIDEHLGAGQRVGPGQLGEPLVPARREAEGGTGDGDDRVAGGAGPEVVVLVVAAALGDVELAGAGHQGAVGGDADGGVEPQPRRRRRHRAPRTARRGRRRRSRRPARRRTRGWARRAAARGGRRRRSGRRASPRSTATASAPAGR